MENSSPKDVFMQSLNRCTASDEFIPSFYERFLNSCDDVKKKFLGTDFEKQNRMLRRSLELCVGATAGDIESLREMNERAETHDRDHLNIEPHHYEAWLETIIATAREFDDQWDDTVQSAWERILGHAVQHMIRHY